MVIYRPIDIEKLKKSFRINDNGKLERFYHGKYWREVVADSPNKHMHQRVNWQGVAYGYHRILWCLFHGEDIPAGMQTDHINGDRHDNRLENLRIVTQRGNSQNLIRHRSGKGLVGANVDKSKPDKWKSRLWVIDRLVHLGEFETENDAHAMYVLAVEHLEDYQNPRQFRTLLRKIRSAVA